MLYKLTDANIRDGYLSDDEFSSGLGYHVPTFALHSFPYWEDLRRDQSLPPEKAKIRADAIYQTMLRSDLIRFEGESPEQKIFTYSDAESLAQVAYSTVRINSIKFKFCGDAPWGRHFGMIRQYGFKEAHSHPQIWVANTDTVQGKTYQNVFPGILDENISVISCQFNRAAVALLNRDVISRDYWAYKLRMAPQLIENIPSDGKTPLLHDVLHEKRHLHQINIESPNTAADYYRELDADMAANASLQIAGVGEDTITATQHSRYFDLLFSSAEYWLAPALESLQRRAVPPNFFRTCWAVFEIKVRLGESFSRQPFAPVSSSALQDDIQGWDRQVCNQQILVGNNAYIQNRVMIANEGIDAARGKNHAPLMSELRKLLERRIFTDPFTESVATRIVEAAYYFNPDLVTADYEPSRKRIHDRLRSGGQPTCG